MLGGMKYVCFPGEGGRTRFPLPLAAVISLKQLCPTFCSSRPSQCCLAVFCLRSLRHEAVVAVAVAFVAVADILSSSFLDVNCFSFSCSPRCVSREVGCFHYNVLSFCLFLGVIFLSILFCLCY